MKNWGRVMRSVALSFLMLFALAAMLPLVISSAHNEQTTSASKRNSVRRHSRAWWRRYRARQRRRRAALERKRALAGLRQSSTDRQSSGDNAASSDPLSATVWLQGNDARSQSTPVISTEHSSRPAPMKVDLGVRLNTPDGRTVGQVAVAVVANASGNMFASSAAQRRALSGVPFADLRRTVIDRMLAAGGWVVNDFERQINGRRVYVVLAQTASSVDRRMPQQSWTFYFTEVDGRIYNIVSNAPVEFSDRMAVEAERVIAMLGTGTARPSDERSAQRR
jgi:hypothetical protein